MKAKKAYVIGTNVSTSLSPTIFQYWFEKHNINGEYGYIEIQESKFDKEIISILKERGLVGLNITIPYKEKIISHFKDSSNQAKFIISHHSSNICAINFITKETERGWFGDNTDFIGFKKSLKENQKNFKKKKAIVIGFGGASKAVIYSLILQQFEEINVFNRNFEKLTTGLDGWIKKMHLPVYRYTIKPHNLEDLKKHVNSADLIVNTTPINVLGDSTTPNINPKTIGFDIVYKPRNGTGFLNHFEPNKRIEGIQMLVYQAAPCFKSWFGTEPRIDEGLFEALYKKMDENK